MNPTSTVLLTAISFLLIVVYGAAAGAHAQEKIKLAHASIDTTNAVWYVPKEKGFYKKYGLDLDLIFIPSSTTNVASLVAGDVQVANGVASNVASVAAAGVPLMMTGCFLTTIAYDFVVNESVKTPGDLRGKSIGISRVGSASDIAAQVFLRALGLEPNKDVAILQVGGATERAAAFNGGRIIGFPASPGAAFLAKGVGHKVMMTTADLPSRYDFPNLCVTVTPNYLASHRDTVKRVTMAIIEGVHFFKTNKNETKKMMAKYSRQNNDDYLESSYAGHLKLFERVPLISREGVETQIRSAVARKPGVNLRFEDIADNSIVQELVKSGFIESVYRN
jgi:ABC-type nitrate/sulfonate/bicarbonate transport system substrate-binding protein